jgi:hypothetical protein
VKVAAAELPIASVAVIVCSPGTVGVSTLTIAVNLPSSSVVTVSGTIGIGVPSQVIVIVLLAANPAPETVVAANPVSGVKVITA